MNIKYNKRMKRKNLKLLMSLTTFLSDLATTKNCLVILVLHKKILGTPIEDMGNGNIGILTQRKRNRPGHGMKNP